MTNKPLSITSNRVGSRMAAEDIGNRKDSVCLQLHGQVSRQPKRCRSAMLDPKGRTFLCVSGSLLWPTLPTWLAVAVREPTLLLLTKRGYYFQVNDTQQKEKKMTN